MYVPPAFAENRPEVHATLIAAHPLALLVTARDGELLANPVPMIRVEGDLHAHLARANPQIEHLRAAAADGQEVLAVFQGPQAYVSPGWYPSKADHGKVVPTWNYLTVQLRAVPRLIEDADWLRAHVGALTDLHEAAQPAPWAVEDAPADFIAAQLRGIVGLELPLSRTTGKWKASQNRSDADRQGVIDGLSAQANPLAAHIPAPRTTK